MGGGGLLVAWVLLPLLGFLFCWMHFCIIAAYVENGEVDDGKEEIEDRREECTQWMKRGGATVTQHQDDDDCYNYTRLGWRPSAVIEWWWWKGSNNPDTVDDRQ